MIWTKSYHLVFILKSGRAHRLTFSSKESRDKDFDKLTEEIKRREVTSFFYYRDDCFIDFFEVAIMYKS